MKQSSCTKPCKTNVQKISTYSTNSTYPKSTPDSPHTEYCKCQLTKPLNLKKVHSTDPSCPGTVSPITLTQRKPIYIKHSFNDTWYNRLTAAALWVRSYQWRHRPSMTVRLDAGGDLRIQYPSLTSMVSTHKPQWWAHIILLILIGIHTTCFYDHCPILLSLLRYFSTFYILLSLNI